MKKLIFCLLFFVAIKSFSQDSLPKFYTKILNANKAQISWINPFENCTQISIQRSFDSLKFYKTIFSSLSPELPQNGFVDNDYLQEMNIYYRIFYVLDDGKFFFTKAVNPRNFKAQFDANGTRIIDSSNKNSSITDSINNLQLNHIPQKKIYTIYKRKITHLAYVFDEIKFNTFKDSIIENTKDTLVGLENGIVIWNPYTPPPAWKPSSFVFANNKGNVALEFPNYKTSKYKVVFYDAEHKELFKLKQILHPKLTFEKANFIKAGWYYFELFENEKLIEKNKFLLESDF